MRTLNSYAFRLLLSLCGLIFPLTSFAATPTATDVEYANIDGVSLKLDVHAAAPDASGPRPIAILVYGGGWMSGNRKNNEITLWADALEKANFAWVAIDYRLAPTYRWPACFDDVRSAIRWVKTHAAEYNGDPKRIILFGYSAGGQLASLAAITATEDTRVQAVVGCAPVTDFEQDLPTRGGLRTSLQNLFDLPAQKNPLPDSTLTLLRIHSPIRHVGATRPYPPPFLIVQGDLDKTVPLQQSLNFQSRLRSTGVTSDMIVIPGGQHRITEWDKLAPTWSDEVIAWLNKNVFSDDTPTPGPVIAIGTSKVLSSETPGAKKLNRLWYREPAQFWTDALPVGNGRLGAMVFGGLVEERLQLNEDSLWTGKPHDYSHPGAAAALPEIRRLLNEGKQKEAEKLAMEKFMSVPLRQKSYQPLADLIVYQSKLKDTTISHYARDLDLDTATANISYVTSDGIQHTRNTFSSFPDRAIVQHFTASKSGQVTFVARLASPHLGSSITVVDDTTIRITGQVEEQGEKFAAQLRIFAKGGKVTTAPDGISVTDADDVTLIVTAGTSFKNYTDISGDASAIAARDSDAISGKSFETLQARHIADHRNLFGRVEIDLGKTPENVSTLPTDERLSRANTHPDPELIALYYQYGRYLLIASSRSGDQPANLQGIWNDRISPPWGSKYTVNINTQMNYWLAEPANLSECTGPLFDMLDDLVKSGTRTARAHYDMPGWVLHHNTDLWRGTAPINNSNHGIWPTGGAWLTRHLWEHYLYTGDIEFLRTRAYPVMKASAEFFLNYLTPDPVTHKLISGPSNSPEHGGLVMGPAMDHQIIRALFDATASAAWILKTDTEFAAAIESALARIAPDQIGKYGQLQEWLQDLDDPKDTHRHVSHLWAVFPGDEITPRTPKLYNAAKQSLLYRGDDGTGWSLGWKIAFWARFLDGDHAYKMILQQLRRVDPVSEKPQGGGSYINLFDAHPPFQIDGNFAATAGITEMLLQSHLSANESTEVSLKYIIQLLPALPSAWPDGSISGIRARGGFEISMAWQDSRLVSTTIKSLLGNPLHLQYGKLSLTEDTSKGQIIQLDGFLKPMQVTSPSKVR